MICAISVQAQNHVPYSLVPLILARFYFCAAHLRENLGNEI